MNLRRIAVRGQRLRFAGDALFLKHVARILHGFPIGLNAHDNTHQDGLIAYFVVAPLSIRGG